MTEMLTGKVMTLISEIAVNYFRLILVVGPAGTGKTKVLQEVGTLSNVGVINVNLELSLLMLELTERQRSIQIAQLLGGILGNVGADIVVLDNIELLFDPRFKQDPLRLLQSLARNRTLIVSWNGSFQNQEISYAIPGHPEHRIYPVKDFFVVAHDKNEVS